MSWRTFTTYNAGLHPLNRCSSVHLTLLSCYLRLHFGKSSPYPAYYARCYTGSCEYHVTWCTHWYCINILWHSIVDRYSCTDPDFFPKQGAGCSVWLPSLTGCLRHIFLKLNPDLEFHIQAVLYTFSFAPGQNHAICTFIFCKWVSFKKKIYTMPCPGLSFQTLSTEFHRKRIHLSEEQMKLHYCKLVLYIFF